MGEELAKADLHGGDRKSIKVVSGDLDTAKPTLAEIGISKGLAAMVRLTDVSSAQVAPVKSRRTDGRGGPVGDGINAAVRDLGIDRTEAQRACKIAAMPDGRF
jgi:hypothetical protein